MARGVVLTFALMAAAGTALPLSAGIGSLPPASTTDAAPSPVEPFGLTGLTNRDVEANVLLLVISGVGVALFVVFGMQYGGNAVATPQEVAGRLGIRLLGLVPDMPDQARLMLSPSPPVAPAEAYRALRAAVVSTTCGESTPILALAGAQEHAGTTTTACNLAMALASGGSRILLIDANLRRPRLDALLQRPARVGLFHVLVGQSRVRDAVQRTADAHLYVMTAGRIALNGSEVLGSGRMKQLLAKLKQGPFDWVILDLPAVLTCDDALTLAPLVDGLVVVLGTHRTRLDLAERAVEMLNAAHAPIVGAVLNRVSAVPRVSSAAIYLERAS